jgi:hypothetical protein
VRARRYAVFASDVRQLGGVVSVHPSRDRCGGDSLFRLAHISGGGDVVFLSLPITLEDQANAAARVLAEFVGAKPVPDANRLEGDQEVEFAAT